MNALASATPTPTLSLEHINKTFGGLVAIEEFSLDLYPGEVVALVGDNGAGKSTLIKIVAGVHRPTRGRVLIDGAETIFNDPSDAQKMGIQVVYQDLALADSQPVYMNMFLGRELTSGPLRRLDRGRMIAVTESVLKELDVQVPSVRAIIRELSGGQRQGVAIAMEVRTLNPLGWSQELGEAVRVQQARHTLTCGRLKPTGFAACRCVFHHSVSISALPCIRRRKTVSGRAPPSLIEMRKPPGEERSTNSATTAFQVSP